MPRSIAEIRKANGGLENLTDEDILQSTFQQYKSYYPSLDAYAADVGYAGAGRGLTGSRISAGIDQYQANMLGLGGAVARAVGAKDIAGALDSRRQANEAAAAYAAQQARELGGVEDWRDITGVGSALNYAGGLAAQSLPYAGEAVAGALTGGASLVGTAARVGLGRAAARTAGAVAASYPSAVGDILSAQREAGGEDLGAAALGGIPYAAINAIGVEGQLARGLRPLVRTEGGVGRRVAMGAIEGTLGEGLGETGQEMINQYAGRMAVNPNETLFNEEANKRYLDSFVGGATLGGITGGIGGIRTPRQDEEKDLTQPDTTTEQKPEPRTTLTGLDTAALMGSPYANANLLGGTANQPFVSSSLYSQEADLTTPAGTAATPAAETPAATTPGTTVPPVGETKPTAPSIFSETDTALNKLGVKPTKNSRAIYDYLVAENIDPASPEAEPVMNALAASNVGEARKAVGEIIRARSPRGTGISTVQQPAGGVGVGSPVVQGGVGNAGPATPVAGAVVGGTPAVGGALQQTSVLPVAPGQPSTTVTTGAPSGPQAPQTIQTAPQGQTTAAVQPAAPIKANTTLRLNQQEKLPGETDIANIAEIARMTGNAGGIDATLDDEAGLRADQRDFTEADLNDLIDEQLGKGKNKERDRKILRAYILSRRMETEGAKGDLVEEIASTFGITEDRVRQIGNPEKLARLAVEKGFDKNQVFDLLGIESAQKKIATKLGKLEGELTRLKAKAKPTKADIARMAELNEQITRINDEVEAGDMATAFKEAGIEGEAGEAFGNLDDAREWQKASTAGSQMAVKLVSIADTIAELQAAAAELKQLGMTQAEAAAAERVNELTAEYQAIVSSYEAKPEAEAAAPKGGKGKGKGKGKAAEKAAEEKDAAEEAEAAKYRAERAAKLQADRNGLAVGDTVKNPKLGTGVVKSFAGDGDATTVTVEFQSGQTKELSVKLAKLEKVDAVQVESPAGVSVQPKAETGEKVGRQVRRAPKPAAEGQAPTVILTQAEQATQAWDKVAADFPEAPKFADLTKAQQNTFIGFGPDNWERGDVELELTKLARTAAEEVGGKFNALRTVTTVDEDNATVELQEQELSRLEAVPGVGLATERLRKEGLGNLVDFVGGWYVTDSKVNWDGGFTAIDGEAAVLLRRGALTDSQRVEWTVYHEVGHAADQTHLEGGGVFSSLPEFNVRLQNGQIKPMGKIMKAAFDHYTNDPTSDLSKHLAYPFDRAQHGDLDGNGIREELFAQLWATYTTRDGREFLEDNLPEVADFMEQAYEQVKQTNYAAANANEAQRTAQAGGQAAQGNGQPRQVPLRQAAVRFRANRQAKVDSAVSKLPKQAQKPVRSSINTISDWARQGLDRLVFTSDLIKRAVDVGIESAAKFESLLAKRATKARELEREVERVANMYAGIEEVHKGDGLSSVNRFIFESTRTGKWGYDSGKFKADPAMAKEFESLGPKAQAYVKAVFAHGDKMLSAKKKAVVDYATSEYDARIAAETDSLKKAKLVKDKANDLKRFARLFKIREGIPYAPIKRFGDHVVVAKSKEYIAAKAANDTKLVSRLEKDPDHYHVSFTETKNEARNLAAQLEEQGFFSGGTVSFKERSVADNELFGSRDSLGAITRLRAMADAKANSGDKGAAMMQRMVSDLYLQALAEGSARKSEMRRRGVSGEIDMLRSFAAQGRADANFVASVQYNPQVQDALQAMRQEGNQGSGDLNRKSEILNEITRRYESSLDVTPTPNINKLTRLSSIYYLATSPAYYLQNLTQPWMMSVPAMSGRHNYGKVSSALFAAYSELGGVMKSARYDQQFDFSKAPADVRDAIQELANRGKIDIGLETELGEFKIDGDSKFSKGWNKVDTFLRVAVQKVEALNRLSTAMAAYRLELAKTGDKQKAIDYADRILTETHGDYSTFNAPRVFNNPLGKVALQFRKFQLIQLTYYAKLLKDAGFDSKEKRAATKALVYSLGHTGLLAGAMGLPGYSAIAWAIGALFGDEDDPLDVTAELRKFIGDEDMANLIMRGAPTLAGVDISGKVGAGNMLSIMPFSQADLTTKAGVIEAVGTLVGGAPIGMVARVADGLGQMLSGNWYKGMEQLLPKGLGDAAKAYRISSEGMTRRNGDIVLPDSEVSAWETTIQALGIQPVQQSVVMERQQNTLKMNEFYQDRSTKIKADYVKAVRAGESTEAIRAAWNKLQEARVKNGYTRQPLSELLRAPQSQAKRERQVVDGVQFNKTNKRFVEEQV